MRAHLARSRPVEELRDARRMAHRMILDKPDAPGRLLLSVFCLEIGAELSRRDELAPDCPFCRHDVDAASGDKAQVSAAAVHGPGAMSAPLVEALP